MSTPLHVLTDLFHSRHFHLSAQRKSRWNKCQRHDSESARTTRAAAHLNGNGKLECSCFNVINYTGGFLAVTCQNVCAANIYPEGYWAGYRDVYRSVLFMLWPFFLLWSEWRVWIWLEPEQLILINISVGPCCRSTQDFPHKQPNGYFWQSWGQGLFLISTPQITVLSLQLIGFRFCPNQRKEAAEICF